MDGDLELLGRWRGGDEGAGQELFRRHFAEVYRFFQHKAGGEADDLVQRTFLACVATRDRFEGRSSFRTYLFAIARNELYACLKRFAQSDHLEFEVTSIAAIVTSATGRLDRAQKIDALRSALAELPAEQQLLLELHYWHELDAAGLAEVFDAPAGTMRVRLLRARRALRAKMVERDQLAAVSDDPLGASLAEPDAATDRS